MFTSYLTTTAPNSNRALMFKEMADANYDIHMLESFTQGKEKVCQIFIPMLYFDPGVCTDYFLICIALSVC